MQLGYHELVGSKVFFFFKVNIQFFQESKETKVLFCCLEGKSNVNDRKKESLMRKLLDTNILTGRLRNLQVSELLQKLKAKSVDSLSNFRLNDSC